MQTEHNEEANNKSGTNNPGQPSEKSFNLDILQNPVVPATNGPQVQKVIVKHHQPVSKVICRKISEPSKLFDNKHTTESSNSGINISIVDTLLNTHVSRPKSVDVYQDPKTNLPSQPATAQNNSLAALLQPSQQRPMQIIRVPRQSSSSKKKDGERVARQEAKLITIIDNKPHISDVGSLLQHPSTQIPSQPQIIVKTAPKIPTASVFFNQNVIKVQPPPIEAKPACLYPVLPSATDVQLLIDAVDLEIKELEAKMDELVTERTLGMISLPDFSDSGKNVKILDFHNVIHSKDISQSVIEGSRRIAEQSHSKFKMPVKTNKFGHISHLPHYKDEMENQESVMETMMQVLCQKIVKSDTKMKQLTHEYIERRKLWEESNELLDLYHKDLHASIDEWPPEFALSFIKPTDQTVTQFCGKDQIMYLDDEEKESYLYYNENSFVEDPVKEHERYKKRISWSESEKQTFLEKYYQHPRDFKKIAQALPLKSIKEVIEYYNIYRIKLNLKAADVAGRKRGRKRILVE
ncbi:Myb-like DNA-binding domain containing protein [Trichomonas vaginalis G3]|uniref:Myb-like DNA-binding domain containing protein n=1 Tax=Trichomonas vaginalis (strain ATCC PRA-98 / G3) TaxID=412133 RepID=A2DGZ6_TRIV3|nr:glycolytic process regulation protein [Trichomonas vaginalis G3]EAY20306.1 Myb-like DNA-binding domain containing protein [Trichomonas vaginalis G3]KAI5530710.1 glycolytic process regulation protein [Trichomonas vaginalis G3]|eukprot:XP_001581292.1 Myb-like DNA-binding domain containing protein [Trichomonas vaginalis G3]